MKKYNIVLHVRHALWCNVLTYSAKRRREIFIFEVLTTTRARNSKSFILCLYMKTICAKQAKVHFAYFFYDATKVKNRKRLNLTQSSILMRSFRWSCRRSFLNSLMKGLVLPVQIAVSCRQNMQCTYAIKCFAFKEKLYNVSNMKKQIIALGSSAQL